MFAVLAFFCHCCHCNVLSFVQVRRARCVVWLFKVPYMTATNLPQMYEEERACHSWCGQRQAGRIPKDLYFVMRIQSRQRGSWTDTTSAQYRYCPFTSTGKPAAAYLTVCIALPLCTVLETWGRPLSTRADISVLDVNTAVPNWRVIRTRQGCPRQSQASSQQASSAP